MKEASGVVEALPTKKANEETSPSWVKKLSPETQKKFEQAQKINPNWIKEFSAIFDEKAGALAYVEKSGKSIKTLIEVAVKAWKLNPNDPEDKAFLDMALSSLQRRIGEKASFESEVNALLDWLIWNKKESASSQTEKPKELQKMTNKEFLVKTPSERLAAITKNNVDASKVVSGEVKNLEFTFTFDGVHNKDLYMKTTAGQVLPQEVAVVKVWWETYERKSLSGEFFNAWNRRLTIHEGTQLEIGEPRKAEEMEKIVKENGAKAKEYLAQNTSANPDVVAEALKRGIDPKFANLVFKDTYEKTPESDRKVVLEEMFTEFDRTRGTFWNDLAMKEWKYSESLSFSLLRKFNGPSWKEKAGEYGFAKERIERDYVYEAKGEGHKPYMETIANLSSKYDVPADKIVQLIYHENAKWNPTATPPGRSSSAYGLGQMIDGTWNKYGSGLDRNNPHDQLEATARYMKDIYNRQGCSWEEVLAYYNTWEGIRGLSIATIVDFVRKNPAIAAKHPDKNPANADEYFKSAVAYYNDMNYSEVV